MTTIFTEEKVFFIDHDFNRDDNLGGVTYAFSGTPEGFRVGYAICEIQYRYVRSEGRVIAMDRLADSPIKPWSELFEGEVEGVPHICDLSLDVRRALAIKAAICIWPEFKKRYTNQMLKHAAKVAMLRAKGAFEEIAQGRFSLEAI